MKNNFLQASIGGIAFLLEEDAYIALENYLGRIQSQYTELPEGREIMDDIEGRIAELILSVQSPEELVTEKTVRAILSQLGEPEEISEETVREAAAPLPEADPTEKFQIPHRLYRDTKNRKIGGVCAGLAAYFHTDPVIFRLGFTLPFLLLLLGSFFHWKIAYMSGLFPTSLLLYTVLWIVIPKAKTPRQRLEMRGEKITASTIEEGFRQEFNERTPPGDYHTRVKNEKSASLFAEFLSILGQILLIGLKITVGILGFFLTLVISASLSALIFACVHPEGVGDYTFGNLSVGLSILLLFLLTVPLVLAVYGFIRILFQSTNGKSFAGTAMMIWGLLVLFSSASIYIKAESFYSKNLEGKEWKEGFREWAESVNEKNTDIETIPLEWELPRHTDSLRPVLFIRPIPGGEGKRTFPVRIVESQDGELPYITVERLKKKNSWYARSGNIREMIRVHFEMEGDTLFVDPTYYASEKIKSPKMRFKLHLPANVDFDIQGLDSNDYTFRE